MVEIKISYEGNLRCKATHVPPGQSLMTDAPVDNMGKGEYFSPTDLVGAAFGTCMLTVMGIAANRHKIDMSGDAANVIKEMAAAPARRIGTLKVVITVPIVLTNKQKCIFENAAMSCPVHKSINHEVNMPVEFKWGN